MSKNMQELIGKSFERNGYSEEDTQRLFLLIMEATKYFQFEGIIPSCMKLENIERDEEAIRYHWRSQSEQAECPDCHEVSKHLRKDYQSKTIQDIASDGLAVYHEIRSNRLYCNNPECKTKIFVERFYELRDEKARKTHRFVQRCRDLAVASGNLPAERGLRAEGSVVCDDTISKYVKAEAAKVIASNLSQDNVKILSVDDFNTRKGDSSSGCTVFIDQETHKVLIIVKGTTKEAAQSVIEKFPSAEFLSRDRATSLASAGAACGKTQVADRFHLVQNAQKAIKDALMAEMPANIFIRDGDGWVESTAAQGSGTKRVFSVPQEDVEKRIQLAGLTEIKAEKYRNTLKMLEMSDKGLRTADIAKELGIPHNKVQELRRSAASTIEDVQNKINRRIEKYPENSKGQGRPPADGNRKTLGTNPSPACESIVEPYRKTVVKMWNDGYSHRDIHPAIVAEGFSGSKNAVYQYLCKLEYEAPCALTRKMKQNTPGTPWADSFNKQEAECLPDLSLEKVSRKSVYGSILNECSSNRQSNTDGEDDGKCEKDTEKAKLKSKKPAMAKYSPLSQDILDLMYGKDVEQPESETVFDNTAVEQSESESLQGNMAVERLESWTVQDNAALKHNGNTTMPNNTALEQNTSETALDNVTANQPNSDTMQDNTADNQKAKKNRIFNTLKGIYPIIQILIAFLNDFYVWLDMNDEAGLENFIEKYKDSEIDAISQFARGLIKDYDAVRNCLLYPHISNGPIEGINSKTKQVHRRGGGRASVELLCAFRVLASKKSA
jgi:transposase